MSDQPIALITGGAQGIGYACAEAIAENGARIVLADINVEGVKAAAEKMGNGTLAFGLAIPALLTKIETGPSCSSI